MASSEKRCLYEILGLSLDCSPEEIRSAYRKLALQRHPDKLIKTGIPESEATASFQELVNAYEVLSDPRERSWYDSHRSQILFSDPKSKSSASSSSVPDLFPFFSTSVFSGFGDTGKGFYKVYGDIFGKIYAQELLFAKKLGLPEDSVKDAPLMGNLESPHAQVTAFYGYWSMFSSVMDFCWVDEYDAMAGMNRKSRRVMEEENKKLRKKAKREWNDTVRGLADFVKKRDKRVIDMQVKKKLEMEKKLEEEKVRKREMNRAKLERARAFEEPDWTKIDEEEIEVEEEEEEEESSKKNELYCVVCSKKFKSDKQWKNHEQSKKHKEKVAELRSTYDTAEEEEEDEEENAKEEKVEEFFAADEDETHVDELREKFEDSVSFKEEETEVKNPSSREERNANASDEVKENDDNEEMRILKNMMAGHKSKKKRQPKMPTHSEPSVNDDDEEIDLMEYNNRRSTRRNRAAKKEAAKKTNGEAAKEAVKKSNGEAVKKSAGEPARKEVVKEEVVEVDQDVVSNANCNDGQGSEDNRPDSPHLPNFTSHTVEDAGLDNKRDPLLEKNQQVVNRKSEKKDTVKRDSHINTKNTSKGKKQKGASKTTALSCETCGEDFDSRNQLHKHLGDTGHAKLKTRH